MAEPARRLDEDQPGGVYDQPGTAPSAPKPDLKALEGGGQTTEPRPGHLHEVGSEKPSRESLSAAEGSSTESQHENQVGRGYRPGKRQLSRFSLRGRITRRRALFGGGIIGTIIAILSFFIISGPAQLVQLSELLQHDFTKSQSDSENRTTHLLRDFRSIKEGDYRYTRVGLVGAKVMSRVVGQFEDAGVKFTGSDVLGRPTAIEIDQNKVAKNNPDVKGMTSQEFDNWLNEKFGVGSGTTFQDGKLDISGLKSQAIRSFINKAGTAILGDNAAVSAVKTRSLKQFFGLDSLFHPFSTAIQNKIAAKAAEIEKQKSNESSGAAEAEAASEVEDVTFDGNVATIEAPGVENFNAAKTQEDSFSTKIGSKLLPGAGLLWATGCTLKGISGAIVSMNRYLTVLPAAVEATSLIAEGSQVQNGGSDITMEQLGATEQGFTNSSGQNIWGGAALQSLESSSQANTLPKNAKGQIENDLPGEYKQAFGTSSTAGTLNTVGDIMLSWFPLQWASGVVPGGPCGLIGGFTIIITGALTQIGLAIAGAATGETGDAAVQAAAQAGEDVAINTIQGQLLSPLINTVVDKIAKVSAAPKLARSAFSGPLGGNLIAYGARAAANTSAILNGGLALGNTTSTIIGSAGQEQQHQFKSESIVAKVFDINDYRSLTGRLAMAINPNPFTDLRQGISNVFNIGSVFRDVSSLFTSHAVAASNSNSWTGSYNWGFPQYGIPNNMLNDPALSDPYQNAEAVGKYLSSVCSDGNGNIGPGYGACAGDSGYTKRIMDCFGNSLTYSEDTDIGGKVWDITHAATATSTSTDVNPVSDTYQNANCDGICPDAIADCGNAREEQWEKIVMFVNDAWNIKSLDCLGGYTDTSDQSCNDLGASDSNTPTTGGSSSGGFTNPFPDGWVPNRLDMGYDGHFTNEVVSPCDGKIIYSVDSQGPGSWEGPYFVVLCSGSISGLPSNAFYFAEGIAPTVKQGDSVSVGQKIGVPGPTGFSEGPGGIEWGLADPSNPGNALAESNTSGFTNCSKASAAMVLSFAQWVEQNLGVSPPASTDHAGCA